MIRNAKVVGSTPIIGTIFSRKIIKLLLQYFALFVSVQPEPSGQNLTN